jgi:adenine phosphoribosyltransferase
VFCHRTRGPLVLARKPGKLPGSIKSASYELEYGKNTLELQSDSIQPGDKCIVIDDLIATGGTVCAVLDMVKQLRATTVAVATIIDLPELGGSDLIRDRNIPFYAGVEY